MTSEPPETSELRQPSTPTGASTPPSTSEPSASSASASASSRTVSCRPKVPLYGLVALLAAAAFGLTGWSLAAGDGRDVAARGAATPAAVSTLPPSPTTTAAPPTTATPALVDLPIPEDSPVDAYADTPHVVHGTLSLPTIGVTEPLHEGVTLTAINNGPSHWPGTALPGELGNVVVAGHRTTYTKPFHDLDLLQPGDPLLFTMNDGTVWSYEMTGTDIVGPDAMHIVDQTNDHTATLFACHPKGSAAQRIVARFRLLGPTTASP